MSIIGILIAATVLLAVIGAYKRTGRNLPLPPGPKKYPLIGNLLDAPTKHQWIRYAQWSKEYNSDVIHLQLLGSSIIILNSIESANDLLVRRSAFYSSRPRSTMINELMRFDFNFGLLPYGNEWRARRRVFWQEFNPGNSSNHKPIQIKYAKDLLQRLLAEPDEFLHHIYYILGETIIEIAYGLDVQPKDDPHIYRAEKAVRHLAEAAIPGSFLVDNLPILKYVPRWVPGAGFKAYAEKAKYESDQMIDIPYAETCTLLAEGEGKPSLISRSLSSFSKFPEQVIKDVASVAFVGGVETTQTALSSFFAAMVLYPDVQRKAQEELDIYVGSRLPGFEDQPHLPYVYAVMLEVLRWQPVIPLGVAHSLIVDDEYKGYHLPKNSIVFGNTWAILHDETVFHEPEEFKPERFLKDGKLNPELSEPVATFGFGRRICPGRYMALDSLWISLSYVLAVFDVTKAKDEIGNDIDTRIEYISAFIRHVLPFKCSIKPRSEDTEKMILDADMDVR